MLYKALKSFSGIVSMAGGEIKDISNSFVINDLVKAGYIVPAEAGSNTEPTEVKKKKTAKKP